MSACLKNNIPDYDQIKQELEKDGPNPGPGTSGGNKFSTGDIAGIVIGSLVGVALIVLVISVIMLRKKKKK